MATLLFSAIAMMMSRMQRLVAALSQGAVVVLPALLPLLPPLLRGELRGWAVLGAHLITSGVLVGVYFLNTRVALPCLLFRNRGLLYLLAVVGMIGGVLITNRLTGLGTRRGPLGSHLRDPARRPEVPADFHPDGPEAPGRPPRRINDPTMILFLSTAVVLGAGTLSAFNQRRLDEAERRQQAEREKLEVELAYLRSQLNPHVFFNTLNSIYVLTDLNVSQARQAILRLSRLMRYLLYQTHEAQVQLSQEVSFLEDYIGLMQLRLTANMTVEFEKPAALHNTLLATMLLQPFVENAFKYGVSTTQAATIFIRLTQPDTDGKLTFEVRNQVFPVPQTGFAVGSGIGLTNTRRRLELLYPGRHELRVTERNAAGEFVVCLTLQLPQ